MKKIILLLLVFISIINVSFAKDNSPNKSYYGSIEQNLILKDPKLISLQKTKSVDLKLFEQKQLKDKEEYKKCKKGIKVEYYNLYVILDRILRANNLQSQNWRLALKTSLKDINASAGSANLIVVNTSLYDSLYPDESALAFIISHELAHLILKHNQISYENQCEIVTLKRRVRALRRQTQSFACTVMAMKLSSRIDDLYEQQRELEYNADSEAVTLMLRAGYDIEQVFSALNLLSSLPNIYTDRSTHPSIENRISNVQEDMELLDKNALINEGKYNLYHSKVSSIKKSSDKRTVVLYNKKNSNKIVYVPLTKETKLLNKAYLYYLDKNIPMAKQYFERAYVVNSNNYITPLYLSYISEYNFYNSGDKKDLKDAKFYSKKAYKLNQNDKFVNKQRNDVKAIFKNYKK